jgi:Holliday junction resolvase-like predicted endonuclease
LHDFDLTGKSLDEVIRLIRQQQYDNESSAIKSFQSFLALRPGDYIAVNNTNHGLFGVGEIQSGYRYACGKHDTGADDSGEFYSHYVDVIWKNTSYMPRRALLSQNETGWQPYGTTGALVESLPPYVARLLGTEAQPESEAITYVRPAFLEPILRCIEILTRDPQHQERAHESLVEDFLAALGYHKHEDIRYRQGRVDITLRAQGRSIAVVEVKRAWDLSIYSASSAIQQAYGYALSQGIRYVVVTNGDTYLLFDRLKGLSFESNLLAEIRLSALEEEDLTIIDRLRPENIATPNLPQLFRYLAECFDNPQD